MLLAGCEVKPEEPQPLAGGGSSSQEATAAKNDGRNPFSVAVMTAALHNLKTFSKPATRKPGQGPPAARPTDAFGPTHYYVRFKPASADQLADLGDTGMELSFEPLDENAAASRPYSRTTATAATTEDIPWLYTAVPVGLPLPTHIQQERLEELFLFSTEDGDLADEDPWEPDPTDPCAPQWNAGCQCYTSCRTAAGTPNKQLPRPGGKRRNSVRENTERLEKAGISPVALYNEAMRLTGNPDEALPGSSPTPMQMARRYNPSGTIRVEERYTTGGGRVVPLRNVEVKSRRWFNLDHTHTNSAGYFYIGSGYLKEAKVTVEFKTERATTRGLVRDAYSWDLVLPIQHQLGSYNRTAMQNLNYTFTYQADDRSQGALAWTAATLFNFLDDMYAYCAANSLPNPPGGINVALFNTFTSSASAPMLRRIAETSLASNMLNVLLPPTASTAKIILQRQLPDITLRFDDKNSTTRITRLTDDLNNTFFHELAHTMHYNQVGNNFWTSYIGHIISASVNNRPSTYGRKTDNGAGLIAISEAWGTYIGNTFTARNFDLINADIATANRNRLENQRPNNDPDDDDGWIVYGMLHDMTDNGEDFARTGVVDNVNSYTTPQLFQALQPDVKTVREYQQRVAQQNSGRQATQVEQLVTSYLW
ncbi:hypothetical protein [Hymenobacter sp. UYP22]|uniref:hypothetical protein n=1 Tax=Hymenobacter sp. UYP22 TaxID=3156348 RepID=UPI0033969108